MKTKLTLFLLLLFILSCSNRSSFKSVNNKPSDNIFSTTYDKSGEIIGFNMFATTCPATATVGVPYICNVDSGGGDEILYMETGNTCSWAAGYPSTLEVKGTPTISDIGVCDLIFTRLDPSFSFTTFSFTVNVASAGPFTITNTNINEDSPLTQIRADGDVEAESEGSSIYVIDNASAASPKCSDNGILGIQENTGAIDFYPYPDYQGICNVAVSIGAENASFQVIVNNINDAPVIDMLCESSILQDQLFSVLPVFTDMDLDTLTWSTTASHTCSWATVNVISGEITGTPNDDDVSTCNISIKANDGTVDSNTVTKAITIENIRPSLTIADVIVDPAGGVFTIVDADVQANEEGLGIYSLDNINVPGVKCSDHALSISINPSNGEITYNPSPTFESICHITVVFDDQNTLRNQVRAVFAVNSLSSVDPVRNLAISATIATSIATTPTATWDPPFTFFDHYEVALGTTAGDDDTVAWTDIGTASSHAFTGLSLTECTQYFISVRVHDVVGNISTIETTPSFYGDITAPTIPSGITLGIDRFFPDGDANSTSWTLSTDNCQLDHYEVAVGTTTSTDDIIPWTTNGLLTTQQFTGFTSSFDVLTDYRNLVRAVDEAGNMSAIAPSSTWQFPEYAYRRDITFTNSTPENEFQVEITLTPSNFDDSDMQADGDDIRFYDLSDTLLEYHVVEFIQGEILKAIVKVPLSGTASIYMAYSNPTVTYGGTLLALNSTVIKDLYARISSNGNSTLSAYTYSANNEIQINGATNYVLALENEGIVTASSNTHTIVGSKGPISARVTANNNDHDILPPIYIAATDFANAYSRITDIYEFYNPNTSAASVDIFDYTTAGVLIKSTTVSVAAQSFLATTYNTTVAVIESNIPILTFSRGGNDAHQILPISEEIYGVPSSGFITFTEDTTTGNIFWSDGTTQAFSGDRGDQFALGSSGNQMSGRGFIAIADKPIAGRQTADSDGSDASSFVPRNLLDKKYIVPTSSQYIAVVCHQPGSNITLTDGATTETQPCPASATHPGKVYFGTVANTINYSAGTIIESSASFFASYENGNQQETNLFGASLGLPYAEAPIDPTIGVQVEN